MIKVCRKSHFNAAHRLFNAKWSEQKNIEIYGKCSNPNYHGHNYELVVAVEGEIDPETGYVIDLKFLKKLIKDHIETPFDHKNLNIDLEAFKILVPTVENIAVVIWNKLRKKIPQRLLLEITLYETPNNYAIYKGE